MMRAFILVSLLIPVSFGQTAANRDLPQQTEKLQALIVAGDWENAAELSRSLKDAVTEARDRSLSAQGGKLADSILTWLPADTETLVVAQEPLAILRERQTTMPAALEEAQGYVLGMLAAAEKETLLGALQGRTVTLAALGARHFTNHAPDPRGFLPLGLIAYQGCAIYEFSEPVPDSMLARPPDESVMGQRVWTSTGTQSDAPDADTFFLSLLEPQLVIVCNNREFLREIVSRRGLPQQPRALPASLPEWKLVDRTAPLWALSHYAADGIGASALDITDAVGIAVAFGKPSNSVTALMISKSDPWTKIAASPDFRQAAKSRKVSDNVWELSTTSDAEAGFFATFVLMAALGFVVLL